MMVSQEDIERLRELLARPAQNIVIVSHTNPDGDAVGSSLAWREALLEMGHRVTCIVPNKYPYFLDWMTVSRTWCFSRRTKRESPAVRWRSRT